jgi:hypothetical protein
MLREILPDLFLLALSLALLLTRSVRSTAANRAPVRSAASPRSRRSAARTASRRRLASVARQPEGARCTSLAPAREETPHGQS